MCPSVADCDWWTGFDLGRAVGARGKPVEIRYDSQEAIPALFAALEGGGHRLGAPR